MDSASSYEDQSQDGDEDSSTDRDSNAATQLSKADGTDGAVKNLSGPTATPSQLQRITETREEKWKQLRFHYNDRYLNLLNHSHVEDLDIENTNLYSTQIGSVVWSATEKEKFFYALSRRSRVDLGGITASLRSKSEMNISAYLSLLEEEHSTRQLYAGEPSSLSYGDIPAAIELSGEFEALLERAADALVICQDRLDRTVGEQKHSDCWLIDHVKANALDGLADRVEAGKPAGSDPPHEASILVGNIFRFSSWLSLTERVFMNSDPTRNDNHWLTHAAHDEVPAVTRAAFSDFHQLALSQLRKVIQSSIFCAESRIRCTKDRGHAAKAVIRAQDVTSAITLIGMQSNRSQFWLKLARRNQVRVVDDDCYGVGRGSGGVPDYDEVEHILSKSSSSRRWPGSSVASEPWFTRELPDQVAKNRTSDSLDDHNDLPAGGQFAHPDLFANNSSNSGSDLDSNLESSDPEDAATVVEDEDLHVEMSDQITSHRQELQLYRDLGWEAPEDTRSNYIAGLEAHVQTVSSPPLEARTDCPDWADLRSSYVGSWDGPNPIR